MKFIKKLIKKYKDKKKFQRWNSFIEDMIDDTWYEESENNV